MDFMKDPQGIETKSMEIIAPYLADYPWNEGEKKIASRLIHASGDVEYAKEIRIHPEALQAGLKALAAGKDIFCDVEMVRTGINKTRLTELGGKVHCKVADPEVAKLAKEQGITRSMMAMRLFGKALDGAIIAIGNAPTALFEVLRLCKEEGIRPALIIGVPVGFVGAAESKDALMEEAPVPYVSVHGNKGGSPIAVAAVNAIMYQIPKEN